MNMAAFRTSLTKSKPPADLAPPLVALCMKCLEKSPDDRPPSARAVIAALDGLDHTPAPPRVPRAVASQPTVEIDTREAPLTPARRSRAPFYLALAAAAGTAVAVYLARATPAPPDPPAPAAVPSPADAAPREAVAEGAPPDAPAPTDTAPRVRAPSAADHLREAERYARQGNHIKELFHLQQAARLEPGNAEALYRLGAALLQNGQKDLGCERLARAGKTGESLFISSGCVRREPH